MVNTHIHTQNLIQNYYFATKWVNSVFLSKVADPLGVGVFSFLDLDPERTLQCCTMGLGSSVWQAFTSRFCWTLEGSSTVTGQRSD